MWCFKSLEYAWVVARNGKRKQRSSEWELRRPVKSFGVIYSTQVRTTLPDLPEFITSNPSLKSV